MAIIPYEKEFSNRFLRSSGKILDFVVNAGTITSIYITAPNLASVGEHVFNIQKNGAPLLSGSDRITVNSGNRSVEKTVADFEALTVADKDVLSLYLESSTTNGWQATDAPVTVKVNIDDGIGGSAEDVSVDSSAFVVIEGEDVQTALEEIDTELDGLADGISAKQNTLVSGTNIKTINSQSLLGSGNISISGGGGGGGGSAAVGNLFSIDAKPNSDVHPLSDYFDSESTTLTNTTAFHGASHRFVVDGGRAKLILPSAASEISTGRFRELPSGDCTIIAKIWNYATEADYANVGICLFEDAANNPNTCDYISARVNKQTGGYKLGVAYYTDYANPNSYIGSEVSLSDEQNQTPIYMKFSRTGADWTGYYSFDGKNFISISTFSQSSYFTPKEFGFVAVNNTHGNTNTFDIEFIYFYDSAAATLPGGGIKEMTSAVDTRIICLGDSITRGFGVYEMNSYPNALADLLDAVAVGYDGNVFRCDDGIRTNKIINKGYDAYTTQNIIDSMLENTILRRDDSLSRDLVIVFAGTNDIAIGQTASAIYTRLSTIVSDLQAEGFEVALCTTIDRNGTGGFDTVRATLNSSINGNAAGADFVIDLYADSRLQNAADSTYFQSDQIHPNAAGMAVIAEIIEAAL